jgi:hypothetical protein
MHASCGSKYYGANFIYAVPSSLLIAPGLRTIQFFFFLDRECRIKYSRLFPPITSATFVFGKLRKPFRKFKNQSFFILSGIYDRIVQARHDTRMQRTQLLDADRGQRLPAPHGRQLIHELLHLLPHVGRVQGGAHSKYKVKNFFCEMKSMVSVVFVVLDTVNNFLFNK